jgi:hypothetical protein
MKKLNRIFEFLLALCCFAGSGVFLGDIKIAATVFTCVLDMLMSTTLFLLALSYL